MARSANSSACVEINAMGALQATNCDWIGGTNTLLFNASGLLAACIQHEMDHLDGKIFIDYLSELKQNRIRAKLKKRQRKAA